MNSCTVWSSEKDKKSRLRGTRGRQVHISFKYLAILIIKLASFEMSIDIWIFTFAFRPCLCITFLLHLPLYHVCMKCLIALKYQKQENR